MFWCLLLSSMHVVLFLVIWIVTFLLLLTSFKSTILAIKVSSVFFSISDTFVMWPITTVVMSYVIPGFEPFVHFFCHEGSTDIWHIRGQQWFWQYSKDYLNWEEFLFFRQQCDGSFIQQSSPACFFTVHRPILMMGDSLDVIHSWSLSDLGVKMDVIPGHVTLDTFLPCASGSFVGACYEICGAYHSMMVINAMVS